MNVGLRANHGARHAYHGRHALQTMASPAFVAEPATGSPDGRSKDTLLGLLFVIGGLLLFVLAVSHPTGNEPQTVLDFPAWTAVHLAGAVGMGLLAVAAVHQLAAGRAPGPLASIALSGIVVFGLVATLAIAVDGFASPALAAVDGSPAGEEIRTVVLAVEQALAVFGYGGFGIAGALTIAAHMGRAGWGMRIAATIGILAFLLLAAAGIVYIGMGVGALAVGFAGMPLVSLWFVMLGVRELMGRGAASRAALDASGA